MPLLQTELVSALPQLVKAVFSQPTDGAEYARVTVRPVQLGQKAAYQAEGIRDNKAYHFNFGEDALLRFAADTLDGRWNL